MTLLARAERQMSTLCGRGLVCGDRDDDQLTACITHDADLRAVEHSFGFAMHLKLRFKTAGASCDM